jgi:hypothetical protein
LYCRFDQGADPSDGAGEPDVGAPQNPEVLTRPGYAIATFDRLGDQTLSIVCRSKLGFVP